MLASDAGLNAAVEILGVDFEHAVHLRQVDADAAVERGDVPFERRANAEGNHRDTCEMTQAHDRRNLLVGVREDDDVGQRGVGKTFAVAVVLAHRVGGHGAFAEVARKPRHQLGNDVGILFRLGLHVALFRLVLEARQVGVRQLAAVHVHPAHFGTAI